MINQRRPRKSYVMLALYDRYILFSVLILAAFGLLMVASASMVISDKQYGYPFHYLIHQAIYLSVGLVFLGLTMKIPMRVWQKFSIHLFLISLFLLLIVLVPGIGHVVNGSRRWIKLGFFGFQVSEAAKLFAILYLASYLQRFQQQVQQQLIGFIKPMLLLAVMVLLLLKEPDFGTAAVITATFLILLFLAGSRLRPFTILFFVVIICMTILVLDSPYRVQRLTTFVNPWRTAFGSGYQLTQSLIAFGRGGLFGVGLGNSIQKLFYLPEAHTDFIFAVIGEEFGLLGELFMLSLFCILVMRIIFIGKKAFQQHQFFSAYLAYGIGVWFAIQTMINLGVNVGLLPTKGLTLPFISFGGSSMLINCIVIGIMLRISFEMQSSNELLRANYHYV